MFREPEIISDYEPQFNEDGQGFEPGSTAQNNFKPPRVLRCGSCFERVMENETATHVCEE
jgi:retron-type reverse transcriptase